MIIFYAGLDGIGKLGYKELRERVKGPVLLSYFNVAIKSRQTWVFRRLRKEKKVK
jgi:hypothetical protein